MLGASIDIGTNTLRLLAGDVAPDGSIKRRFSRCVITRLGGGYTEEHGITDEAAERAFLALRGFRELLDEYAIRARFAAATSVVRRAVNRDAFLERASKEIGSDVRVIDGEEEARLSLRGVASVVNIYRRLMVMDIGGGSTEFILTRGGGRSEADPLSGLWSMELGVVHLVERFLKSDPPIGAELLKMETAIKRVIAGLKDDMSAGGLDTSDYSLRKGALLVGTAGTVTTLAAIEMALEEYDPDVINNFSITFDKLMSLYDRLRVLPLAERAGVAGLEKGREDLIVAGTRIVLTVMEEFGFKEMTVSDAGLLEGLLLEGAAA